MNTILVVMQCESGYDDSWASPILVTSDQTKAEDKIKEMEARQVSRDACLQSLHSHMQEWRENNPRPTHKNTKNKNEDLQLMREWTVKHYEEDQRVRSTFPEQVKKDISDISEKSYWQIEEVPWE